MKLLSNILSLFKRNQTIPVVAFEDSWIPILQQDFGIYNSLPPALQDKLHTKISQFMATKSFEGCNGFELTDAVVLLISAQACLLVLNQEGVPYPRLNTILVYPTTFRSVQQQVDANGIVSEREVHRLGESWTSGSVILAWDSTLNGARNEQDGHNVTMHELAHQLDQADGNADGAPLRYLSRNELVMWARTMEEAYTKFLKISQKRGKTVIDRYGATNPAEFFAVVSETFFEKPKQLQKKWPDLYELMKEFYDLDPLNW